MTVVYTTSLVITGPVDWIMGTVVFEYVGAEGVGVVLEDDAIGVTGDVIEL